MITYCTRRNISIRLKPLKMYLKLRYITLVVVKALDEGDSSNHVRVFNKHFSVEIIYTDGKSWCC